MRIAFIAGYCLITSVAFAHDDYPADCCVITTATLYPAMRSPLGATAIFGRV
jgi:hypothetical protein